MRTKGEAAMTGIVFLRLLIALGICFSFLAGITQAENLPKFRQGMWEFNRTIENSGEPGKPQTMTVNKCTNPSEDMKKQNEIASKIGCKLSPVTKDGNTYSFTADCNIQNTNVQSKSVITAENDSAYNIDIEVKSDAKNSKEVLKARRTGDCSK
jgi:hypothetical protein